MSVDSVGSERLAVLVEVDWFLDTSSFDGKVVVFSFTCKGKTLNSFVQTMTPLLGQSYLL